MNKEEKIKIMGNIIMKHFLSSLEFLKLYLIAEAKKKIGGATPQGMWDLGSLTRDGPCNALHWKYSLNHWTARKVPPNFNNI